MWGKRAADVSPFKPLPRGPRRHGCADWCRDAESVRLNRVREWQGVDVYARERPTLSLGVKHRCGSHCMTPDPQTPVRLDFRPPDPYDRKPVRQPCGHLVAPGIAHACRQSASRPLLFRLGDH